MERSSQKELQERKTVLHRADRKRRRTKEIGEGMEREERGEGGA